MNARQIAQEIKPIVLSWFKTAAGNSASAFGPESYPDALLRDGTRSVTDDLEVATGVTIDGVDIDAFAANVQAWQIGHLAGDDPHPGYLLRAETNHAGAGQVILHGAGQINFGGFTVDLPASGTVALGAGGLSAASINNYSTPNHTHAVAYAPGNVADTLVGTNNRAGLSLGSVSYDYTPTAAKWGAGDNTFANVVLNGNDYTCIAFHDSGVRVDAIRVGGGIIDVGFDAGWGAGNVRMPGSFVSGATFASGFTGSGWRIDTGVTRPGYVSAEFDDLTIRGQLRVYELLIHQIRAANGSYMFSATGKAKTVASLGGADYQISTDPDTPHGFATGDLIRAQRFNGAGVYQSDAQVQTVYSSTQFDVSVISGSVPQVGYEYVRLGNVSNTNRQGAIYVTADDSNAPYLDVTDGVDSFAAWGGFSKVKVRLGKLSGIVDSYWGALSGYGLYTNNIYLTGGIRAMSGRIDGILDIGVNGEIRQGTGAWGSTFTGLRMWNTSGVGRIGGYNNNTLQWYGSTDGTLRAAGGKTSIDFYGVRLKYRSAAGYEAGTAIAWDSQANLDTIPAPDPKMFVGGYYDGVAPYTVYMNSLGGASDAAVSLSATTNSEAATIYALATSSAASIQLNADYVRTTGWLDVGNTGYGGRKNVIAGDITFDYTPTSGNWSTDGSTLLLNGLTYSTIGFHDSGSRVDFIRAGGGQIVIGYDGGFGAASVRTPGGIYSDNWFRTYGDTGWYSETHGGGIYMIDANYVRIFNGKTFVAGTGGIYVEGASTLSLQNSWANYNASGYDAVAQYYKDPMGFVHVQGELKDGTTTNGTVIANLPAGYRPFARRRFIAPCNSGTAFLDVSANGDIQIYAAAGNSNLSLNSIYFRQYQ